MLKNLALYAVKRIYYLDRDVFYGITKTGEVPPELYGYPDDDGNECLIKFFPALKDWYIDLDSHAKDKNWVEIDVLNIADFYTAPLPRDVRWFVELAPTEITITSRRSRFLEGETNPVRQTFVRKNVRLEIELLNKLETFAEQNSLHISDVIATALRQYLCK